MKNNFNKYLYAVVLAIFIVTGITSCSKDTAGPQVELSYKMLSDKTWFLDYVQTINSTTIKTQTYLGQASYFINFLKDNTTLDSDGIVGTYSVKVVNDKIFVKINAKTKGGNPVSYDYTVESMGAKVLIMSFENSGTKSIYYYSTQ